MNFDLLHGQHGRHPAAEAACFSERAPQIWDPIVDGLQLVPQERVQHRIREQIVDSPVPHINEEIADCAPPQERVQNRATCTGKVFTVKMRHHGDDQVSAVGFNKGLHMPRSGDVMVPVLHIQEDIAPRQGSAALRGADSADGFQSFVPGQGSTALRGADHCCLPGSLLTRGRSVPAWEALEASLPPAAQRELHEAWRFQSEFSGGASDSVY